MSTTATFEDRVPHQDLYPLFEDIAALMAQVEHRLYVDVYVGHRPVSEVKREYLQTYGITGRQFNAVSRALAGKVDGALESKKLHRSSLQDRIASAEKWLKTTDKKVKAQTKAIAAEEKRLHPKSTRVTAPSGKAMAKASKERSRLLEQVHHKRRYLTGLKTQLDQVEGDIKSGNPRFCFGGRKLLHQQFNLKENGYGSHQAWKDDWQAKRTSQFLCLGSHTERSGNQTLTAMPDGQLRLRVPPSLVGKYGRCVSFPAPAFPYGGDKLRAAWAADKAVTYRFLRRANGEWYLQATIEDDPAPITTIPEAGAIGLDLNANHVALGEVDHFGNPLWARSLPIAMYKRSHDQVEASLGDVVAEVVSIAKLMRKPLVIEDLDFSKKRARIREEYGHKYARMLSGFACKKFRSMVESRCAREGVELIVVNPAYTSLIGLVKFARGYGLTGHQAAAVTTARRGMGPRRKICKCRDGSYCSHEPRPKGLSERLATKARTAFPLPERNRGKHVWSDWGRNAKRLREDFSLGRRPSEGEDGGASAPSLAALPGPKLTPVTGVVEDRHVMPWDNAEYSDATVPGCESPAEVGSTVRPAEMVVCSNR